MKKSLLIFVLFSIVSVSNGQEKYSLNFKKLESGGIIYKQEEINIIDKVNKIDANEVFLCKIKTKGDDIYLAIKEKNYWLPFYLNLDYENISGPILVSENKRYLFINTEVDQIAGQTEIINKVLEIIDLKNHASLQLDYFNATHFWKNQENAAFTTSKKELAYSNLILDNNFLTLINNCIADGSYINCDNNGGVYEFQENALKKIKHYDKETMLLKPIKYIGPIAIGMTLEDLRSVYPNINFAEKPNPYLTCAAGDSSGFEVWNGTELLGFVTNSLSFEKVNGFVAISPKFSFGKINTNTTAEEVLKLYPKCNVRLDLVTEWEHIYIQELGIELVFKTDENNRMGVYENEDFVKIKNKKAQADFIVVK